MASQIWGAGGGPPAYATVRINPDGSVMSSQARRISARLAHDLRADRRRSTRRALRERPHRARRHRALPFASNSWGSITTASVGPAVRVAALRRAHACSKRAAELLGRCVELALHDSVVSIATTSAR
jgi:xanthine dehydrogenase YagR molybdenum-binding subunit